jgi:hypothetical protein
VIVHGAPAQVAFGEKYSFETSATVIRAGFFRRHWTQFCSILELSELYHVGFEPKEAT